MTTHDPAAALARTPRHPVALGFLLCGATVATLTAALCVMPDKALDVLIRAMSRRD